MFLMFTNFNCRTETLLVDILALCSFVPFPLKIPNQIQSKLFGPLSRMSVSSIESHFRTSVKLGEMSQSEEVFETNPE